MVSKANFIFGATAFEDLQFGSHPSDGVQAITTFANGYGASVVKHSFSCGHAQGLWELAVIKVTGDSWNLCYSTPVTSDVLGWLDENQVSQLLEQIAELPNA